MRTNFQFSIFPPAPRLPMPRFRGGYTLIELVVAVGLFAVIMTLASGGYLLMISVNRQAQATATGVDNLAFAIETMTRTIRTGTHYSCSSTPNQDCPTGGTSFYVRSAGGNQMIYSLSGGAITQSKDGTVAALTDPSVQISSLTFYVNGALSGGSVQPRVVFVISGTVSAGSGKTESFTIESSATMRGLNL